MVEDFGGSVSNPLACGRAGRPRDRILYEKTLSVADGILVPCDGAHDVARHKEWMDTAQDVKDDLKDALDAKLAPKVVEDAAKLAGIGKQEERRIGRRPTGGCDRFRREEPRRGAENWGRC